jgi:hypothetical protein
LTEDEKPESDEIIATSEKDTINYFVFIVDRSGSMRG